MPRDVISTPDIARPVGPFSSGVRAGELIFLSGQVAQDPATGKLITGDVSAQAEQIFRNFGAVLRAAGKRFADVVRVGVYLTNIGDYSALNAVYGRHFEAPYPARTAIAVSALPLGARVEMEFVVR
jgi:2-iminobutanoate/2-iminopropanoate deaminase